MKKFAKAIVTYYENWDEEGPTFIIGLILLGVSLLIGLAASIYINEPWVSNAIWLAGGLAALGLGIWYVDICIYLAFCAFSAARSRIKRIKVRRIY